MSTGFALAGCNDAGIVPSQHLRFDVKLTPAQARADMVTRSDDIEAFLGGEWQNQDNLIATACDRRRGYYYHGVRNRHEAVKDQASAATRLEKHWRAQGYETTRQRFRDDYLLRAVAPNGTVINISLGDGYTDFQTDGPCLAGDWVAISDDDFANHRNDFPRNPMPTPAPTE
ncbi:hypothetical protein ACFVU2_01350 [Leifsonia sp. NPDC058194]|uniref:hypothetical protein n=1 Tax=Leifsonia sp. NPDC058194 TaxID=3346374 RepID=UPI0036DB22CC